MPGKGKSTRSSKKSAGRKRSARAGASKRTSKRASKRAAKGASGKSKDSSRELEEPRKPKATPQPTGAERKKKIERMKQVLLERLGTLQGGMEQALEGYQSIGGTAGRGDVSDLAADSLDGDTALQLAESGSTEIAQIGSALGKIEEGEYGKCDVCGGDIPWSRLEAVPYATTCIECKRKQEITGGPGADASGWSAVDDFAELSE